MDDSTPQTGKVTHRVKDGAVKQVDFLSGVAGLTTKDLARRAIEMDIPDIGRLRVIHPVDVLDSRIERIAEMATDIAAVHLFLLYGIDPLEAVPLEQFRTTTALHKVRWPQILAEVTRKRESMRKLAAEV